MFPNCLLRDGLTRVPVPFLMTGYSDGNIFFKYVGPSLIAHCYFEYFVFLTGLSGLLVSVLALCRFVCGVFLTLRRR